MNPPDAATDSPIRVVLAELKPMVAAIVRDAVRGEGIQIVDEVPDRDELTAVVQDRGANVIIVPTEGSGVALQYHDLLLQHPELKLLTIAAVPQSADLYELRPLGTNVGRQGVVAAIRSVFRESDVPHRSHERGTEP